MPAFRGRPWRLVAVGITVFVVAAVLAAVWELSSSYRNLARDSGNLDTARERLADLSEAERKSLTPEKNRDGQSEEAPGNEDAASDTTTTEGLKGPVPGAHEVLGDLTTVLVLGSDGHGGASGGRADVIMLGLIPNDRDQQPMLVSLPRDLWVPNPCTGGRTRINAGMNGCGEHATGPELMALTVQGATGVSVDHYVSIDFDNFESAIEAVGGVETCVNRPMRERRHAAEFEIPAGCTTLDAETALAWVRSRTTEQRVNGRWRTVPGVNDLTRNERQRDLLLQIVEEARRGSMGERLAFAEDMLARATADDDLRLATLARLGWRLRDVSMDEVVQIELPVTGHVTSGGAQVLLPKQSFREVVEEQQPGLLD